MNASLHSRIFEFDTNINQMSVWIMNLLVIHTERINFEANLECQVVNRQFFHIIRDTHGTWSVSMHAYYVSGPFLQIIG